MIENYKELAVSCALVIIIFAFIIYIVGGNEFAPECYAYNEDHYMVNRSRYVKKYKVDCDELEMGSLIREQTCTITKRIGEIESKVIVPCPNN